MELLGDEKTVLLAEHRLTPEMLKKIIEPYIITYQDEIVKSIGN